MTKQVTFKCTKKECEVIRKIAENNKWEFYARFNALGETHTYFWKEAYITPNGVLITMEVTNT
jgi:hypothetical protein